MLDMYVLKLPKVIHSGSPRKVILISTEGVLGVLQKQATRQTSLNRSRLHFFWLNGVETNYYHPDPKYDLRPLKEGTFLLWIYHPHSNSGKYRFIGIPYQKCNNLGGHCHWGVDLPSDAPCPMKTASPSRWRYRHVDTLSIINVPEMENFIGYWFLSLKKRGLWFDLEFFFRVDWGLKALFLVCWSSNFGKRDQLQGV